MVKKTAVKGKKTVVGGNTTGGDSKNALFKKSPRNFRIGGDIQPKRDLTRMVKWPRYVRIQRQKAILMKRLKVPPTIAQFQSTLDKNQTDKLFKLLAKYTTESRSDKKQRLKAAAEAKDAKAGPKPMFVKFGLNHVTTLIEQNKAKLVVIAHDVDPVETVVHLPALCRQKEVPFCFVRGKAALGKFCHMKTATCLAVTDVHKEDFADLQTFGKTFMESYNKNDKLRRNWGGGVMGLKNQHMVARRERIREIELAKKANM
jgi:large subunit ribosomal protein L7Ae